MNSYTVGDSVMIRLPLDPATKKIPLILSIERKEPEFPVYQRVRAFIDSFMTPGAPVPTVQDLAYIDNCIVEMHADCEEVRQLVLVLKKDLNTLRKVVADQKIVIKKVEEFHGDYGPQFRVRSRARAEQPREGPYRF